MTATHQFPLGNGLTVEAFDANPYPLYRDLRQHEPVTWLDSFGHYLVTRYSDVQAILSDSESFITGTEHSLIMDTFGEQMLSTEGPLHDLFKNKLRSSFTPASIRQLMDDAIRIHVNELIDGFANDGNVELRSAFASRLPILSMLSLFGLPAKDEHILRQWYDSFEAALANFTWDADIRHAAHHNVRKFHHYMQAHIDEHRNSHDGTLLEVMLHATVGRPLSDAEIRRNALLIFFGGISTVEALIMNTVYSLLLHPTVLDRVKADASLMPRVLEEVMRWLSPVQSATRHVTRQVTIGDFTFRKGDTVNCMLASANHDPLVFENPDIFDIDRPRLKRHLGFAMGEHHCLGSNLAKLEARIAVESLLDRLPALAIDPARPATPRGYEFRQPKSMHMVWPLV